MIGVAEKDDGTPDPEGVAKDDLIVFTSKLEDLKTKVESFSSSPVNYEIGRGEIAGKSFVLVTITEFSVRPVISRKNGEDKNGVLEEGAIYVRALKDKPSSVKLVNPVDIQEFLERATDKQISSLHRRGWKHETETMVSNKQAFEKERENF